MRNICLAFVILIPAVSSSIAEDLIQNGGFEELADGFPVGWTAFQAGEQGTSFEVIPDQDIYYEGSVSIKLTNLQDGSAAGIRQDVELSAGYYTISLHVRTEQNQTASFLIGVGDTTSGLKTATRDIWLHYEFAFDVKQGGSLPITIQSKAKLGVPIWVDSLVIYAVSHVFSTSFFSEVMGEDRNMEIYLPAGYDPTATTGYPVVYWLHGIAGNYTTEPYFIETLDELMGNGTIEPFIVVRPDGTAGSWYYNSVLYGPIEDYIVFDLVDFIDANYRTIAHRSKRFISGFSMGGYGSMMLALRNHDRYRAVASISGMYSWPLSILPGVLEEYEGPPYAYTSEAGVSSETMFDIAGLLSPNPDNPDLPLDSDGNAVDSVWSKWEQHCPSILASDLPTDRDYLAIYFGCGTEGIDSLTALDNGSFEARLDSLGLDYESELFSGGHKVGEERLRSVIAFLDSAMKSTPTGVFEEQHKLPESIALYQNYPNPFNPSTTIAFSLSRSSDVTLKVFNILGQEVAMLVSEKLPAGNYRYEWDAKGLASSVYVYRLQAGSFVQAKKLVLLK